MGMFTRDLKSLDDLFLHGLKDIYYAENKIVKTLPKLIDAASDAELKKGLKQHLIETENQVKRLEQVFELIGEKPKATRCPGIDGILTEGDDLLSEVDGRTATNVAIIASAQAVEHYEITRYGTLIAWAEELGKDDVIPLLERSLKEEKAADKKLTTVAETRVNRGTTRKARSASKPRTTRSSTTRRKVAKYAAKPRKRPAARRRRAS
ncbi:Ferritin-like domain-containing protein [Hyphomicrobium sp. 1Nfss2.1]